MSQARKVGTMAVLAIAFILFFVVFPGWVFIPVIPALVLLTVGVLSERRPRRTLPESSASDQNNDRKAA